MVGHFYQVLPLSAYSPSDFTVWLRECQREYLSLMSDLREIYLEEPNWLKLGPGDASPSELAGRLLYAVA